MKTSLNQETINQQSLRRWENLFRSILTLSALRYFFQWRSWLSHAVKKIRSLNPGFAQWSTRIIQTAYRFRQNPLQNKRHVLGIALLVAGVLGYYSGLFFDSLTYDHAPCEIFGLTNQCYSFETKTGWCFMSWYVFLENTKAWILLIFASIAGFFFIPQKYSGLSFVFFSVTGSLAWTNLLHIIGYARSHESFRALPAWEIIVSGVMLAGIGILLSNQAVTYWEHHKKRGNWQKWPLIFRSPLSQGEKNKLYALADKEYDQVNKMI